MERKRREGDKKRFKTLLFLSNDIINMMMISPSLTVLDSSMYKQKSHSFFALEML